MSTAPLLAQAAADLELPSSDAEIIWGLFAWGLLSSVVVAAIVIGYFRLRAMRRHDEDSGPYCSRCGQLRASQDHQPHGAGRAGRS